MIVYGDGQPVSTEIPKRVEYWNIFKSLLCKSITVANADSLGSAIFDVYSSLLKNGYDELVIIGHPKASTNVSISNLERFVDEKLSEGNRFCTFEDVHL